ncbi:MAG: hypothetical protein GY694_03155 [Gammaproteobacteria bacterium]|nr:hypothetical protein [Gammaproteobacteria bacterium]
MSSTLTSQRQKTPEHIEKYVIVMLRTVKQEFYQLNEDEYIYHTLGILLHYQLQVQANPKKLHNKTDASFSI